MRSLFKQNPRAVERGSSYEAKQRLQVILTRDRNNISADIIERKQAEIISFASKLNGSKKF